MAINFTDEQKLAINVGSGTLVSAAAGSGKTAVLAERGVRLFVDDPYLPWRGCAPDGEKTEKSDLARP